MARGKVAIIAVDMSWQGGVVDSAALHRRCGVPTNRVAAFVVLTFTRPPPPSPSPSPSRPPPRPRLGEGHFTSHAPRYRFDVPVLVRNDPAEWQEDVDNSYELRDHFHGVWAAGPHPPLTFPGWPFDSCVPVTA